MINKGPTFTLTHLHDLSSTYPILPLLHLPQPPPTGVPQSFGGTAASSNYAVFGEEDNAGSLSPEAGSTATNAATEAEARWTRIVANDLENLPFGLVVAWGSLMTLGMMRPGSVGPWSAHATFISLFLIGRVGHTLCFV